MLNENEFQKWVVSSHAMFEIFEARFDVYPLSLRWTQDWLTAARFTIEAKDVQRVEDIIDNFEYNAFRSPNRGSNDEYWGNLTKRIDEQFRAFLNTNLQKGECGNVGLAVMPYLFIWNFQRFKEYFKKRKNFSVASYFNSLGNFLSGVREQLEHFQNKSIVTSEIEEGDVRQVFEEVNDTLKSKGIGNNEPVGVAKLLHIFAPSYFPLIDNSIAKSAGLNRLDFQHYLEWMRALKRWLRHYSIISELEKNLGYSILKLVDQGFYVMCSIKLKLRVSKLGLQVG